VGKHISSSRCPAGYDLKNSIDLPVSQYVWYVKEEKISSEKNLEVLNLLIVMVTKFSGLAGLWQG
jgi:hypothetical protein